MAALFSVKVGYSGQVSPFFEAEVLQETKASLVGLEDDSEDSPDSEPGSIGEGVLDQPGRHSLPLVRWRDVVADLCRLSECHSTLTIGAQAAPSPDFVPQFFDIDGIVVPIMKFEPASSRVDIDWGKIRGEKSGFDGFIVDGQDLLPVILR